MRARSVVGVLVVVATVCAGAMWFLGATAPVGSRTDYAAEIARVARESQGAHADVANGWEAFEAALGIPGRIAKEIEDRERRVDEERWRQGPDPEEWMGSSEAFFTRQHGLTARDAMVREEFWQRVEAADLDASVRGARAFTVFVRPREDRIGDVFEREGESASVTADVVATYGLAGDARVFARVQAERMLRAAEAGDWAGASARMEDAVFASRIMLAQSDLLSGLVGMAMHGVMESAAIRIMATMDDVPPEFVLEMLDVFGSAPEVDVEAMVAVSQLEVREMRESLYREMKRHVVGTGRLAVWRVTGRMREQGELIETCGEYLRNLSGAPVPEIDEWIETWKMQCAAMGSVEGLFADVSLQPASVVRQVELAGSRGEAFCVIAALWAYARVHGAPPKSMEMLVPEFLEAAPEDVYAPGSAIRYIAGTTMRDVVLYSVGEDGVDDGGVSERMELQSGRIVRTGGDLVYLSPEMWRVTPVEEE